VRTIHASIGRYQLLEFYQCHEYKGRRTENVPGKGGIDVGGAVESFTGLKSFADMARAKGSLGLIGEECASVEITVITQQEWV